MNEMKFTIVINATKQTVWDTLWQDETFKKWAGLIDPGTYMLGSLEQGKTVQFISAENGYGVTSLVEKVIPNELVVFRHSADTQDSGAHSREEQWTGGKETYELVENNGVTTLTGAFDVPAELEDYFNEHYPRALQCVKELAE